MECITFKHKAIRQNQTKRYYFWLNSLWGNSAHTIWFQQKANILVIRSGFPQAWFGILRNLDPTNIVWGIWGIRVENSNLIRHSLNARHTITKTNKRHIDFRMSREHPPTQLQNPALKQIFTKFDVLRKCYIKKNFIWWDIKHVSFHSYYASFLSHTYQQSVYV